MRRERRAKSRIDVLLQGTLLVGACLQRCVVLNMCSRGFLIWPQKGLELGHTAELEVELHPNVFVTCVVYARHVTAGRVGALVIEMSEQDRVLWRKFRDEKLASIAAELS